MEDREIRAAPARHWAASDANDFETNTRFTERTRCWNAQSGERVRERRSAKAKGVKFGRKPKLTPYQQREAQERLAKGDTQRSVARSYGVAQSTISRLPPAQVTNA